MNKSTQKLKEMGIIIRRMNDEMHEWHYYRVNGEKNIHEYLNYTFTEEVLQPNERKRF